MTLTKNRRPTRVSPNQRKRTGQHHNHSRHYVKTYWPYLPVFAVLGLGILLNSFIGRQHHSVLGYATDVSAQVLLQETNGERTTHHEAALQLNPQLTAAAQAKAKDMATRNYWAHVTPDGKQPWDFVTAAGYQYEAAGENLAYGFGSSAQIMDAWMHSAEHRANILDGNYQDVGFAVVNVPDYQGTGPETLVVAEYGEPVGMINQATNAATPSAPVVLGTEAQNVSRLQLITTSATVEMAIAALCGAAIMLFFVRHAFAWHKVLVRGEDFFIGHPFFDVFLMASAVLTFLLSHAAGTIL